MKTNTVARKYKTFPCPCYFLFNWPRKARISKKKFPVPYPIIYKPGKEYLAEKNWLDLEKINSHN